jgi:hypothetical protein
MEDMAMRRRIPAQPDLFESALAPIELSILQRTKALQLLQTLLREALSTMATESSGSKEQEAGDDQDYA